MRQSEEAAKRIRAFVDETGLEWASVRAVSDELRPMLKSLGLRLKRCGVKKPLTTLMVTAFVEVEVMSTLLENDGEEDDQ